MSTSEIIGAAFGAGIGFLVLLTTIIFLSFLYKKFRFDKNKRNFYRKAKLELERKTNELRAKNIFYLNKQKNELKTRERNLRQEQKSKSEAVNKEAERLKEDKKRLNQQEAVLGKILEKQKLVSDELNKEREKVIHRLEEIADLTSKEAREELFLNIEKKELKRLNKTLKEVKQQSQKELKKEVNNILANAIERFTNEFVEEKLTTGILLENKEIKGKIIGKDGRNIKSFENASGTDLIIEKDSNLIKIASFNPVRREVAVNAMNFLIKDGRIQPQRIEETLKKENANLEAIIREKGQQIVNELGITNIDSELVYYIGKLKYRTSYGQNVLQHSIEVAKIAGALAKELRLDDELAIRSGLLHDIGKSVDYEVGLSHVDAGVNLAQKYNESPVVINAIHSHHGDVEPDNIYSVLVTSADTISAARPGARDNVHEDYLKRMEGIEKICDSISGIQKSYAVKSGRVIRVIVDPIQVNDYEAEKIGEEIKRQIKKDIQVPGEIKVTVIREKRFETIV